MLLTVLFFILAFLQVPEINGWAFRQTLGLGWLSLVVAQKLSEKFHWTLGICFGALAINGIAHGAYVGLGTEAILTVMTLLFFTCAFLIMEERHALLLLIILGFTALGDSMIMVARYFTHLDFEDVWWVVTNHSLDASFVALMMPLIWCIFTSRRIKISLIAIMTSAILLAKSNTGIFVALSFPITFFIASKNLKNMLISLITILLSIPLIAMTYGFKFMHATGRFAAWKLMMDFWKNNLNIFIGGGPGSYWIYANNIQTTHFKFSWMHNDWLQQLFENGFVGLASCGLLYGFALTKSFNRPYLFSMVVGFGIITLTLYPNHLFFFQLAELALLYLCFAANKPEEPICQIQ